MRRKLTGKILTTKFTTLMSIILCMAMIGCGSPKEITNYPGMEGVEAAEGETGESTVVNVNYSEGKVSYIAKGSKGENVFSVNAQVVGDEKDTYPVYDIKYADMSQTNLINVSAFLVGGRQAEVLMPLEIADEDYLANRLAVLEKRRDKMIEKGKEAAHAVTAEIEAIQEEMDKGNFGSKFTVQKPDFIQFIDLHDYYEAEYGVDVNLQFSFVEAEGPDGLTRRFDVIKFNGNTSFHYYTVDYNYNSSNSYYLGLNESALPASFDKLDASECEALGRSLIDFIGISGYECTKTFPACDYGDFTDGEKHAYEKPAYCSFYTAEVNGKVRPCNSATDFYSNNMTETRPLISADNICTVFSGGTDVYTYDGYVIPAGDACMYDSTCICIGENEQLIEAFSTNMLGDVKIKTDKAKLLSFEDVDGCAQNYFAYLAAHENPGYEVTVDRVELGMCRTIGENDSMFMVPAWYYLAKADDGNPLQEPVMAVNAIDGSIINVKGGGITVVY